MNIATAPVAAEQRYTHGRRCLICGGAERDPRGKGRRCHGFLSPDGEWAHCSREEHSGVLVSTDGAGTYAHKIGGACKCGAVHSNDERAWDGIVAAYDYRDERGSLLYQVVRKEPKAFVQRRPNGDGTWEWRTAGMRRVLYRLPELAGAPRSAMVFVVEGEKDVDTLKAHKLFATCNSMGAGKWSHVAELAQRVLRGRHVAVIADADDAGRAHAEDVRAALCGHVATLRVFELPKKDATEWFDAGGSADELLQIAEAVEAETFDAGNDADPWQAELDKALADVTAKLDTATAGTREPLFALDAVDLLQRKFDGARWLVAGLITRGGVAMIGGEPKAAVKTWTAQELALAICTGTRAFGEFFAEQGIVVYFFAEDLDVQVRNRIRAELAGAGRMLERGRLHLRPRGVFLDVMRDADLAWIVASVRAIGKVDLLILDPLRDIHSAEENESDSMRDVMRRLRILTEILGCTVLVVHHAVKRSKDSANRRPGQNFRGSSVIHGSIDALLAIEDADGDGRNVFTTQVVSQVKGARSAGAFALELTVVDDDQGEAVKATWSLSREKAATKTQSEKASDDDVIFAFVRDLATRGITLTRTGLRTHDERPIPERRVTSATDRLLACKRLALTAGRVCVPGQEACNGND